MMSDERLGDGRASAAHREVLTPVLAEAGRLGYDGPIPVAGLLRGADAGGRAPGSGWSLCSAIPGHRHDRQGAGAGGVRRPDADRGGAVHRPGAARPPPVRADGDHLRGSRTASGAAHARVSDRGVRGRPRAARADDDDGPAATSAPSARCRPRSTPAPAGLRPVPRPGRRPGPDPGGSADARSPLRTCLLRRARHLLRPRGPGGSRRDASRPSPSTPAASRPRSCARSSSAPRSSAPPSTSSSTAAPGCMSSSSPTSSRPTTYAMASTRRAWGSSGCFRPRRSPEWRWTAPPTSIAHGSTGAGNDHVRFDAVTKALAPDWRSPA